MKTKHDQGFSLIEVLVAIVILAAFVVPTCSALVLSARMNAKAQALMQAQLDVSSAVETLMARGVDESFRNSLTEEIDPEKFPDLDTVYYGFHPSSHEDFLRYKVFWHIEPSGDNLWYQVAAVSSDGLVKVETTVRKVS